MAMARPKALDLCCGGGGSSRGLWLAGFDVTGVDVRPQPHYPYPMIVADTLTVDLSGYALILAGPPCQPWSVATPRHRRGMHPDILADIRARLVDSGVPYVIENVPGAPLIDPVMVCGETLRLGVRRHRLFESNLPIIGTPCIHDRPGPAVPVYGSYGQSAVTDVDGAREAMGIDWLPWPALTQAIPPAYTMWIGLQAMAMIGSVRTGRVQAASVTDAVPVRTGSRRQDSVTDSGVTLSNLTRSTDTDGADLGVTEVRRRGHSGHGGQSPTVTKETWTGTVSHEIVTPRARVCPRDGCGHPLIRPVTGRWPVWCSHACRQAGYRVRHDAES